MADDPDVDRRRTVMEGYDEIAADYAAERSEGGRLAELAAAMVADLPAGARALDAGCGGGGPVAAALAGGDRDVVGLDVSRGQLRLLGETHPTARRVQGDLTALPFAADAFDALASAHAVIHVPRERHAGVFAEFARVLRPGGEALLVVGSDAWEGRNADWLGTGTEMAWSFYGREQNLALLREAGFEVRGDETVDDELGGSFCAVRARLPVAGPGPGP